MRGMVNQKSNMLLRRPSEAEVVLWLKRHLLNGRLASRKVKDILVDADPSYLRASFRRELEPTGTVWIGNWRPDVICVLDENRVERIAGFEIKSDSDHEKGIIQANRYRDGVHESYLCVPLIERSPDWLRQAAQENGIGLLRTSPDDLVIDIQPTRLRPDPKSLLTTRRYILGESTIRALGLNKPLHYAAVLMAYTYSDNPSQDLLKIWGIKGSAVMHALRGAKTLGLLSGSGEVTLKGRAYADTLKAFGFELAEARNLTSKRRLIDFELGYAAVLRSILLDHPAIEMIIRVLAKNGGGPMSIIQLAELAEVEDEGMAHAVFGLPPQRNEVRQIRPSTRFNLKAALYDVGLIDSPLSRGASGQQSENGYDPRKDVWQLGKACLLRPEKFDLSNLGSNDSSSLEEVRDAI